jgi:hypothetical protein
MKIMDHMHLIVVSETVSDFDPPTLREMDLCIKGCLKPRHAGKELWRKADVLRESSFEVPPAQSMVVRDIGDAKRAPGREYVRRSSRHRIVEKPFSELLKQEIFCKPNSAFKGPLFRQLDMQA